MKRISRIGSLSKQIYRAYSLALIDKLTDKGFSDLRPSFLEVLISLSEYSEAPSIKEIGQTLGLKKQTMTSHLNELEVRGYIDRRVNSMDKREQNIFLTGEGQHFKLILKECINDLERDFGRLIGEVELDRVEHFLEQFHSKMAQYGNSQLDLF